MSRWFPILQNRNQRRSGSLQMRFRAGMGSLTFQVPVSWSPDYCYAEWLSPATTAKLAPSLEAKTPYGHPLRKK